MSNEENSRSDRAYYWINDKTDRLDSWIDNNPTRFALIAFFAGFAFLAIFLDHYEVTAQSDLGALLITTVTTLGPEFAGIVIGVVTIDYLNERRQNEQLKAQLIRQMGSRIRDVAVPAVDELAAEGWLFDGTLQGQDFRLANLEGANLEKAHLEGADLTNARLTRAFMTKAHLEGAQVCRAMLQSAIMFGIHLEGADMRGAHLEGAHLDGAHLNDAVMLEAHLTGAFLLEAHLDDAELWRADLQKAKLDRASMDKTDLREADLSGATGLTYQQLLDSGKLIGATLPKKLKKEFSDLIDLLDSIGEPLYWDDEEE